MRNIKVKNLPVMLLVVVMFLSVFVGFAACGDEGSSSSASESSESNSVSEDTSSDDTEESSDGADDDDETESDLTYVFEAEDTDLTGKIGAGYSGSATEEGLIAYNATCGASNDRYLTYLYKNGLSIDFEIESTEDVSGITLEMRLSCEMQDITITSDAYKVQVTTAEGKVVSYTYDDIALEWSGSKSQPADFADFTVTTKLKLAEGTNTISLITNNEDSLGGTAAATAPLVNCIKLTKGEDDTVEFSMEKMEGNY